MKMKTLMLLVMAGLPIFCSAQRNQSGRAVPAAPPTYTPPSAPVQTRQSAPTYTPPSAPVQTRQSAPTYTPPSAPVQTRQSAPTYTPPSAPVQTRQSTPTYTPPSATVQSRQSAPPPINVARPERIVERPVTPTVERPAVTQPARSEQRPVERPVSPVAERPVTPIAERPAVTQPARSEQRPVERPVSPVAERPALPSANHEPDPSALFREYSRQQESLRQTPQPGRQPSTPGADRPSRVETPVVSPRPPSGGDRDRIMRPDLSGRSSSSPGRITVPETTTLRSTPGMGPTRDAAASLRHPLTTQRPSFGSGGGHNPLSSPASSLRPQTTQAPAVASHRQPPAAAPHNPLRLSRPVADYAHRTPMMGLARPLPSPIVTRPAVSYPVAAAYYPTYNSYNFYPRPAYYGYYGPTASRVRISPWLSLAPIWWGPVLYPSGFGISWSSGSFGLSFSTSAYSPFYAHRPYYDSWYYNGWGYSSAYYGGWSRGWYGGFSYVYNPWPVYRTHYLYSPPTLVYETAYSQPPAQTVVYQTVQHLDQPLTVASTPVTAVPPAQHAHAEQEGYRCSCACGCNGQVPCTCEYPCGSEYDDDETQAYLLSNSFVSYAVSLNPETIWASYAGFDRIQ